MFKTTCLLASVLAISVIDCRDISRRDVSTRSGAIYVGIPLVPIDTNDLVDSALGRQRRATYEPIANLDGVTGPLGTFLGGTAGTVGATAGNALGGTRAVLGSTTGLTDGLRQRRATYDPLVNLNGVLYPLSYFTGGTAGSVGATAGSAVGGVKSVVGSTTTGLNDGLESGRKRRATYDPLVNLNGVLYPLSYFLAGTTGTVGATAGNAVGGVRSVLGSTTTGLTDGLSGK